MTTLHSTHSLAEPDRFAYWQDVVSSVYVPTRNRSLSAHPFDGTLHAKPLGSATLTRIASMPIEYERKHWQGDGAPFIVALSMGPRAVVTQRGRQSEQRVGDIVLVDGAQPFVHQFPDGDDQIVLTVPRPLLLAHVALAEQRLSLTLESGSPLGRLAAAMITEAWGAQVQPDAAGDRLIASTLDVLDTAFAAAFGDAAAAAPSHPREQLARVHRFLRANLDDRSLTPDSIAQAVHVSPRTLNRLFAQDGTTAMRWLWQQRLAACRAALRDSQFRSVSDAALAFGFTNLAHFSRVFKAAYGVSPKHVLQPR